jgi:hypothetical protein
VNNPIMLYVMVVCIILAATAMDIIWSSWCRSKIVNSKFLSGHHPAAKEICDAMGLANVRWFRLEIDSRLLATVSVEQYVTVSDVRRIQTILRRFNLKEVEDRP